jgi:hypothetical protein
MVEGGQRDMKITKEWLRGQREDGMYQKAVKQAMLIAAQQVRLDDARDPVQKKYTQLDVDEARSKIESLKKGAERIVVTSTTKKSLQQVVKTRDRERDMLIKFSKKACIPHSMARKQRAFIIDNGELLVYKGKGQNDKLTAHYKLKDATIRHETIESSQVPKWEDGYVERIRVDCEERLRDQKKALYLYASDKAKVDRWKRAFQLAKVLVAENDRRSLKVSIGRATSGALQKAWEGLAKYYSEIASTRNLVRNMAMRLVKVDISRGWTKFRLAYKKKEDETKLRQEKQMWAARFMSEKLARMGSTKAKPVEDVREHVITRIQKSFRRYREDMIFDRLYPLGSNAMSRVQEAKLGKVVDFRMSTRALDDIVKMLLRGDALAKWTAQKEFFATKKPTYSDDLKVDIGTACFYVSDNLSSLSFGKQTEDEEGEAHQALSKADWSKFVNLDRISSVVLFTEPARGAKLAAKDDRDAGVWCTINGPRVAWDKQIKLVQQEKPRKKVLQAVGDATGLKVPQMLVSSQSEELTWVSLKLTLSKTTMRIAIPAANVTDANEEQPKVFAVVHILGFTYTSSLRDTTDPDFGFVCEAEVPVATAEEFVALDQAELGIEIFMENTIPDDGQTERTLELVGSEKLIKLFNPKAKAADKDTNATNGVKPEEKGIREWIGGDSRTEDFDIQLAPPYDLAGKKGAAQATVKLEMNVRKGRGKSDKDKTKQDVIISPELVGGGVMTSLFTSHRSLWFDKYMGNGQFNMAHVANFIEISLGSLRFPTDEKGKDKDDEDDEKYPLYRIKLSLQGFSLMSVALHRPKKSWGELIDQSADPNVIKFQGSRLFMPLPPGSWSNEDMQSVECASEKDLEKAVWEPKAAAIVKAQMAKGQVLSKVEITDEATDRIGKVEFSVREEGGVNFPKGIPTPHSAAATKATKDGKEASVNAGWNFPAKINLFFQDRRIDIQVLRAERQNFPPQSFPEFMGGDERREKKADKDKEKNKVKETAKFHSAVTFDNHLLIDQKRLVSAFLFKEADTVVPVDAYTNYINMQGGEGVINMEFALRDRDFVKGAMGQAENRRALCVGDKAMLVAEEPCFYPESSSEFSKRFCQGVFDPKKAQGKSWADDDKDSRGVPLREPCLSSEYQESGLGSLVPKRPFKQSFLPSFCTDIIPYKFVLPMSEKQFLDQHLPGYYHKIMDDLVKHQDPKASRGQRGSGANKVVTHLSHLSRQVPVTLLAMYADGTCDVEIANDFMDDWHDRPNRKLSMPGTAVKAKDYKVVDKAKSKSKGDKTGLQYYFSKDTNDPDAGNIQPWDSVVSGIDQGDGWIRVGTRFLQTKTDGATVLTANDPLIGSPPKVMIKSAKDLSEGGQSGMYMCQVKIVPDKANSQPFKTKPLNQAEPQWNEEKEMPGWSPGDGLEFKVMDNSGSRTEVGKYLLPSAKFHPHGWEGDILLEGSEAKKLQPMLRVKVTAATKPAQTPRAILQRVHTALLNPVHYSGINIYDARFKTTEDVLGCPAPNNDFNPREDSAAEVMKSFAIACGPMPPDASPAACQYEWSIGVRSPNETEMYKFAAMLRRCVRMEHFQQALKMNEYQSKVAQETFVAAAPVRQGPTTGGQLEVLLVEARRLLPKQSTVNKLSNLDTSAISYHHLNAQPSAIRHTGPLDENYVPNLKATACSNEISRSSPVGSKISTFVNFRMVHKNEIIPYRGQKVQMSPAISDTDSPSWANDPNCERSGGWVFRTGNIDPEKYPDLVVDFEVLQAHLGRPTRIGIIQVPVTQRKFLSNPDEPFKNLWLPLVSVRKDATKPVANPTGEIHIMARWIPADRIQLEANGQQRQQMSVKSRFLQDMWPKVCAQRLKEPVYNCEAQFLHYNPNLARPALLALKDDGKKLPEAPKDHFKRHAVELASSIHYVECLERRQNEAWDEFEEFLNNTEMAGVRIGEVRLLWLEAQKTEELEQLAELVQRGIPSVRREKLWAELTLSSRVMEKEGISGRDDTADVEALIEKAEEEYQTLLERGLPQNSDAMKQMQEDAFNVASWESTTPPLPEALDLHLRRLKKAQRVCTALIALDHDCGVVYSESLLVLAFFLLLPQGCREVRNQEDDHLTFPSESSVFWLLYTLICSRINGTYREYYGKAVPYEAQSEGGGGSQPPCLVAGSGAMQDVTLLECCLAYHENALWQRLQALGFQLSTVFYGAFMRLFATYMPTASVFRFWDILFAQSTDFTTEPHARSYLIDLAFGLMRAKRQELMQCNSALEIRLVLLGFLGSLYDTCTVVDITMVAHTFLWGNKAGFASGKIGYLWTQREDLFRSQNSVILDQNRVLKVLCHLQQVKFPGGGKNASEQSTGVTTKDLLKNVLPVLQQNLENAVPQGAQGQQKEFWGMHRPLPLAGSVLYQNSHDQVKNFFMVNTLAPHHHKQQYPHLVKPLPEVIGTGKVAQGLEPSDISAGDIHKVMERDLQSWAPHSTEIFAAFSNRHPQLREFLNYDPTANQTGLQQVVGIITGQASALERQRRLQMQERTMGLSMTEYEEHISLNELFISLICASRGTLGEKAAALFNIYSYHDPRQGTYHWKPVSRLAKSITNSGDMGGEAANRSLAAPRSDDEKKQNVLKLTVESNYFTDGDKVVGEVYIPLLSPFIGVTQEDIQDPTPQIYNIWGPNPKPRARNNGVRGGGPNPSFRNDNDDIVCVGEMYLGITWTPKRIGRTEEGQLTLALKHIKFFTHYISEVNKLNPWVTVHKCKEKEDGDRLWEEIKRWDPRGLVGSDLHSSYLTTHGAYGGVIMFDKGMKDGIRNAVFRTQDHLNTYVRDGHNMGFDPATRNWRWNEVWGIQRSVENLEVLPEFVHLAQRKNVMDIHGVRMIVNGILQRAMLNFTNRESILVADSLFNRQGAVPGFLEAILTPHTPELEACASIDEAKEKTSAVVICTYQVVLEHERQMKENGGFINLFSKEWWAADPSAQKYNITTDMSITETSATKGKEKLLWIRYVRAGDGERRSAKIKVDKSGDIPREGSEVELELQNSWPHTKITKDEFVSCLLGSPLLGESLRRIGNCDHVPHAKRSIPLEVTIMDPHHIEEDQQLVDMIDMQQSVLLEVWDADMVSRDFLGEAWLPALSGLTSRPKDIVLPLYKADYSEDAEPHGPSREDPQKEIGDETKNINNKVTGELYVSVAWKFPVYDETKHNSSLDLDWFAWINELPETDALMKYIPEIEKNFTDLHAVVEAISTDGGTNNIAKFCEPCKIKDKKHKQIFDNFFKSYSEDVLDRAKVEEKKHTGSLEIQIHRARNLRAADAKKVGKKVDPLVKVWVRNDVNGHWRKRPFFQTKTVRSNQNPEFNFKDSRELLTGSYEERMAPPEEGWVANAKAWTRSAKTKRHLEEDRATAAIARYRFGADGLQMYFVDSNERNDKNQREGNEGGNHNVEVFIGDSIHEFKSKLAMACYTEADHWRQRAGEGSPQFTKFSDIEIGAQHLVMVFVPSPKIQRLFAQQKTDTPEYKRAYTQAKADPSSWQPLDPSRSFLQYPQFGFGRKQQQMLRVVEATEAYKTQNLRYKKFDEDLSARSYMDFDDPQKCYGWAKYVHKEDKNSVEWRAAFIGKSKADSNEKYEARWIFQPYQKTEQVEVISEKTSTVLLGQRAPKFDNEVREEHRELLEQAKLLRATGKSDWEIEVVLNKLLDDKYAEKERLDGNKIEESAKVRITVDIIRSYLQRQEEEKGKELGNAAAKTGAGNTKG